MDMQCSTAVSTAAAKQQWDVHPSIRPVSQISSNLHGQLLEPADWGLGFQQDLGRVDCNTDIQWLHCLHYYCCCTLLQEEASEEEAELDDETWAKNVTAGKLSKGEKLAAVDHSTMDYPQFRRRFYIEVPEIQRLTEEEVALLRKTEGVKVRGLIDMHMCAYVMCVVCQAAPRVLLCCHTWCSLWR